jgi:hypothetical protein
MFDRNKGWRKWKEENRIGLFTCVKSNPPIPVAARSKAWVCGRSFAGIAGSNPTGGMDVCLL